MLNSDLSSYTHEELSNYTHAELSGTLHGLVIDRTAADVERWKVLRAIGWAAMSGAERDEWMGVTHPTPSATKGMYTHNDLNRVESAVIDVSAIISELGYKHPKLVTKTDWSAYSEFTKQDMNRYLGNIGTLRESIPVFHSTPAAPSIGTQLDYVGANNIEKILVDIKTVATKITQSRYYAGEIIAGEV